MVAANEPYGAILERPHGYAFTYTRDGATVIARGLASAHFTASYIGLADGLLLVGSPLNESRCGNTDACTGNATLFDLNRFAQ